jgi:RNA polymerase sigma factor (sigma-70 family)
VPERWLFLTPEQRESWQRLRQEPISKEVKLRAHELMSTEAPQTTRQVVETVLLDPHERGKLVAVARSGYGIQSEDSEDLLQETAVELLRQSQYVQNPRAFVFAIFRRRCSHFVRSKVRRRKVIAPHEFAGEPAESSPTQERLNRRLVVRQALTGVSSSCRKLLAAHYLQGESLRDAAARLSLANSGIYTVMSRCLRRLRACLA